MKRCINYLIGLFVPILVMAQATDPQDFAALRISEPVFILENGSQGNIDIESMQEGNISNYLAKNVKYPKEAERANLEGVVVLSFDVLPNGSLANYKVIHSVSRECDNAVIVALKKTDGMWIPGVKYGVPAIMQEKVKVRFSIDGNSHTQMAQKYSSKGHEYLLSGDYEKALKFLNKALKYAPEHTTTLYFCGIAKYKLNDMEGALADFERVDALGSSLAMHIIPEVKNEIKYASDKDLKKHN